MQNQNQENMVEIDLEVSPGDEYQLFDADEKPSRCKSHPFFFGLLVCSGLVALSLVALGTFGFFSRTSSSQVPAVETQTAPSLADYLDAQAAKREADVFRASSTPIRRSHFFPGIELLGQGYDIFEGNPMSGTSQLGISDPGIKQNFPIFDVENEDTPGVTVFPVDLCESRFASTTTYGMSSYQETLSNSVGMSSGASFFGAGASFSLSAAWSQTHEATQTRRNVLAESFATCSIYRANILQPTPWESPRSRAPLHASFLDALEYLSDWSTQEAYFSVIGYFGTHAIFDGLVMGARSGVRSEVSAESFLTINGESSSFETSASASAFGFTFGFDAGSESERLRAEQFDQQVERREVISIGTTPQRQSLWQTAVRANPAPTAFNLLDLSAVIRVFAPQHMSKVEPMRAALDAWCTHLARGDASRCAGPAPDRIPQPPPPPASTIQTCIARTPSQGGNGGSDYSVHLGTRTALVSVQVTSNDVAGTSYNQVFGLRLGTMAGFGSRIGSNNSGRQHTVRSANIPAGERIVAVSVNTGREVVAMQFHYSGGGSSRVFGNPNVGRTRIAFDGENARLIGFHGRHGTRLDSVGFFYAYDVDTALGHRC